MTLKFSITFIGGLLGPAPHVTTVVGHEVSYDMLEIDDTLEEEIEVHRQWLERITGLTVEIETG